MKTILAACIVCFMAAPAISQTVLSLRGGVSMPVDRPLTIADIAEVSGDDAERIRAIPLLPAGKDSSTIQATDRRASQWTSVSIDDVRRLLDANKINLGRTTLRGSSCTIRLSETQTAEASRVAGTSKDVRPEPSVVELNGPSTVRQSVALAVAGHLNVEPADVRIAFEQKDEALLNQLVTGRRVDVQPAAAAANEVLPLRIYIYNKDRLDINQTISIRVLVRRERITATQVIERRSTIDPGLISRSEAWVPASEPVGVSADDAIGMVTRQRISMGQVITAGAIEPPLLIKKGDKAEVHCLSGTVTLKAMRARALSDGRDGEVISFQIDGSKRTFSARVNGRGLAVMSIGTVDLAE